MAIVPWRKDDIARQVAKQGTSLPKTRPHLSKLFVDPAD